MPNVSVIVPVYNAEGFLRECIDSILTQTYKDFELILVDDGSPDNSGAICDEYAQKDLRVCVIHKENGGVSSARNVGLEAARGEWVYFVDSDDRIEPYSLEHMIEKTEKYDLVVHGLVNDYIYKGESSSNTYEEINANDYSSIIDRTDRYGLLKGPVCKLFKLELIKKNGLHFDSTISYGEDTKFSFEYLACCNNLAFVPEHNYHYCFRNGDSLKKKKYPCEFWYKTAMMLRDVRLPIVEKFNMSDSYMNYIKQIYFTHIVLAILSLYEDNKFNGELDRFFNMIKKDPFCDGYNANIAFHKVFKVIIKHSSSRYILLPLVDIYRRLQK